MLLLPAARCRYVAQVLTPATPHLLYGLIDEDADLPLDSTPPLLGIAHQVRMGTRCALASPDCQPSQQRTGAGLGWAGLE